MQSAEEKVRTLGLWKGPVEPKPLGGGITNVNFTVEDDGAKFVVRVGDDIPIHQIMRFNERAASQAANAAGISPEVVHSEPGVLVIDFIDGHTYAEADVSKQENLERILPLIRKVHKEVPRHLRGPSLIFWVFHVLRDYAQTLKEGGSAHLAKLPRLMDLAAQFERTVGAVDIVYGHNDLLAANFIEDRERIWLIDWDYGGFNTPLFDLANLATNNGLAPEQEEWVLKTYFGRPPEADLWGRYAAMKCASLLRETMWSMVSEIHSELDFNYSEYTRENLDRFERSLVAFRGT